MDPKELLTKIEAHKQDLPKVRCVTDVYAAVLAPLADRLTQEELDAVIALGALVHYRSSRMVPVLTWDQVGKLPCQGWPVR